MGKRRIYQFGLTLCVLASCNTKRTYYSFEGLTVTRIDQLDKSVFVYGKTDKVRDTNKYFEVSYNDMRDGIDMYLVFKKDKTAVEVIPFGMGRYNFKNVNNSFVDNNYPNTRIRIVVDSFKNNETIGIIRISNSKELEKKWSDNDRSRVKVSSN